MFRKTLMLPRGWATLGTRRLYFLQDAKVCKQEEINYWHLEESHYSPRLSFFFFFSFGGPNKTTRKTLFLLTSGRKINAKELSLWKIWGPGEWKIESSLKLDRHLWYMEMNWDKDWGLTKMPKIMLLLVLALWPPATQIALKTFTCDQKFETM